MTGLAVISHTLTSSASTGTDLITAVGGIIVALIAVAGVIGTWAALRVGRNSAVLATYKTSAESWEHLANSLKAEKEMLEGQHSDAMATIRALEAKCQVLEGLATGQPAVERLSQEMQRSFETLNGQMNRIEEVLRKGTDNAGAHPD